MRTSAALGADLVRLSAASQMISNSDGRIAGRCFYFAAPLLRALPCSRTLAIDVPAEMRC